MPRQSPLYFEFFAQNANPTQNAILPKPFHISIYLAAAEQPRYANIFAKMCFTMSVRRTTPTSAPSSLTTGSFLNFFFDSMAATRARDCGLSLWALARSDSVLQVC